MDWFDGINPPDRGRGKPRGRAMSIPFLACMTAAAALYRLPPRMLSSIRAVKGVRPGLVHMNANEMADLGVIQVNTAWIQPLVQYARIPPRIA